LNFRYAAPLFLEIRTDKLVADMDAEENQNLTNLNDMRLHRVDGPQPEFKRVYIGMVNCFVKCYIYFTYFITFKDSCNVKICFLCNG
jgi:hypothetical protein